MLNKGTVTKPVERHTLLWLLLIAGAILLSVFFSIILTRPGAANGTGATAPVNEIAAWSGNPSAADTSVVDSFLKDHRQFQPSGEGPAPCLECHEQVLTYHDKLGTGNAACWSCHNKLDWKMQSLVLSDGTTIAFDESTRLCGQCHQPRYEAWKAGTHGIPGTVATIPCVACHNPHRPQVALTGITKPHPAPLDGEPSLPTDTIIIISITFVVLLGLAIILARRREAM